MIRIHGRILRLASYLAVPFLGIASGCQVANHRKASELHPVPPIAQGMPSELQKTVMPSYIIEAPDILNIETVHAVPKSPYNLKTLDIVSIRVLGTLPEAPIGGAYPIEPGGTVNLGAPYGVVKVTGMTVQQAGDEILKHLKIFLKEPSVAVALAELGASQRVAGQYLVGPDGTVRLGGYGSVSVAGRTLDEAKFAIEHALSPYLEDPVVSINVHAYNSKVYYIILQGANLGDAVFRYPLTGNETVLDAISQINGLQQISSKKIWVARATDQCREPEVLPVDWCAISEFGLTPTNYQLFPGDRVFVAEDRMVAFDNKLAKFFAPLERTMGFSLLSAGTATRYSGQVLKGGGNPRGGGSGF